MRKIVAGVLIFIVGLVCGLIFTYGSLHAQGSVSEGDIMTKMDQISKSQEDIIAAINSMKEDLQIIKIRVTQSQ